MADSSETLLKERLEFIGINSKDLNSIQVAKPIIMAKMPDALAKFYNLIMNHPKTGRFFSNEKHVSQARSRQVAHWDRLSSGRIDGDYVNAVTKVGEIHAAIGLEPRWYIGGYALLLEHLVIGLVEDVWARLPVEKGVFAWRRDSRAQLRDDLVNQLGALLKIALLDIDFSISVYLDAAEQARLRSEAEALAGERSRIIQTVGEAMRQVALGNLTYRMPDELPAEYNQLRQDFNAAVTALEQAMKSVNHTARAIKSSVTEVGHASNDLLQPPPLSRQEPDLWDSSLAVRVMHGWSVSAGRPVTRVGSLIVRACPHRFSLLSGKRCRHGGVPLAWLD